MENIWSSEIDPILNTGQFLESTGVRNWGLNRDTALTALETLYALQVPILGGDVYVSNATSVESNYDNWYCNRNAGETNFEFVERSIAKARNYISNYPLEIDNVLFALVPDVVLK